MLRAAHFYCAAMAINRQIRATINSSKRCDACSCFDFYAQRLPLNYWWFIFSVACLLFYQLLPRVSVTQLAALIQHSHAEREMPRHGNAVAAARKATNNAALLRFRWLSLISNPNHSPIRRPLHFCSDLHAVACPAMWPVQARVYVYVYLCVRSVFWPHPHFQLNRNVDGLLG